MTMEIDSHNNNDSRKLEILINGYYYDVTKWAKIHPGGGVINFYTENNEDASIPIKQFHLRSEKKVTGILKCLRRRPATEIEEKATQKVNDTNKTLTEDFIKLHNEIFDEGIFTPSIFHVSLRILELILFLCLGAYLSFSEDFGSRILGTICISTYGSRGGMLGHEAGHKSMTGNPKVDNFLQSALMGLCIGLSGSFWSSQHNRHHAMPQRLKHDVDLETLPILAFNKKVVRNSKLGKSFWIKYQAILFLPIDTFLVAVLFKFYTHPRYIFHKELYGQLLLMIFHYVTLMSITGFWMYCLAMWISSVHLFGTFAMSHTHLPVSSDPGVHWVQYGLEHTMNVDPSNWTDWAMGYLNYQIEHHLFPTIPNFRLHKVTGRVKALAAKHNIPYHCVSYTQAIIKSLKNLKEVSHELNHSN